MAEVLGMEKDAALAYNQGAIVAFGEFAHLNDTQ